MDEKVLAALIDHALAGDELVERRPLPQTDVRA
jgi:hypothetical protein